MVEKRRVQHYATCLATRRKAHRAHELARSHWRWRHAYGQVWRIRFNRLSPADRAWAWNTGACESGNDPTTNTGNSFEGSHQYLNSTWRKAVAMFGGGWPAHAYQASWHHQAYVSVRWRDYAGATQWPRCGV